MIAAATIYFSLVRVRLLFKVATIIIIIIIIIITHPKIGAQQKKKYINDYIDQ